MPSHSQPKEARVFCSCCLNIITPLWRTSLVAWSLWPPGIYSFCSVIQLKQTMTIYRQERATASYSDGLGMLPEASRAREPPTLGSALPAPGLCSQCIVMVTQTASTQIVLKFSLLRANIGNNPTFFDLYEKKLISNWLYFYVIENVFDYKEVIHGCCRK